VTSFKDLGVTISDTCGVSQHCLDIAKKGFRRINAIFSCFYTRNPDFLLKLYQTFVRPTVEYASEAWSPFLLKDIDIVERVQRYFTRRLPGLKSFTYSERLKLLNLSSLEERRIRRDLIMVYKIVHGHADLCFDDFFEYSTEVRTRGHMYKLRLLRSAKDIRKHFFCNRTVNIWNDLHSSIVMAGSLSSFKSLVSEVDLSVYCRGRAL
jgi:hypothetical protein